MKNIVLSFFVVSLGFASEVPSFSAFTYKGKMYVTILGDSCNKFFGQIQLNCYQGRMTMDYCENVDGVLKINQTRMRCPNPEVTPKVLTFSLQELRVPVEAKILNLSRENQEVEIRIR